MITIDITRWWRHMTPAALRNISGSQAEHGEHAGQFTWGNALKSAAWVDPLTDAQQAEAREYFGDYGAWEPEEIAAWPELHLRAMFLQETADSARTWELHCATTQAEWPLDEDKLTPRQALLWAAEGPPDAYPEEWGADGFPSRVVAEFCR